MQAVSSSEQFLNRYLLPQRIQQLCRPAHDWGPAGRKHTDDTTLNAIDSKTPLANGNYSCYLVTTLLESRKTGRTCPSVYVFYLFIGTFFDLFTYLSTYLTDSELVPRSFTDEELYEMERESPYLTRVSEEWEDEEDDGLHMKVPSRTKV